MPESDNYLKSLKPFQDILDASEAEYRDIPSDDWDAIIRNIIAMIQKAALKKKVNIGSNAILQKVCVYIIALWYKP